MATKTAISSAGIPAADCRFRQSPLSLDKATRVTIHLQEDGTKTPTHGQSRIQNQIKVPSELTSQNTNPSFLEVLTGKNSTTEAVPIHLASSELDYTGLKSPTIIQGRPAILFDVTEQASLISKYQYTLIGKFSHGKPTWKKIIEFFKLLKLKSDCKVSIFDHKHLYIVCSHKANFNRLWLRLVWSIDSFAMRVFKWEPHFCALRESSIAPVWIRFEGLPLYMFDHKPLLDLSNAIGKPICVDPRNLNGTMLNSARVCVELDVSKPLVDLINLGFVRNGSNNPVEEIMVQVFYDIVPAFCCSCWHIGHSQNMCKRSTAPLVPNNNQRPGKEVVDTTALATVGTVLTVAVKITEHVQDIGTNSVQECAKETEGESSTQVQAKVDFVGKEECSSRTIDVWKELESQEKVASLKSGYTAKENGKIEIWQPVDRKKKSVSSEQNVGYKEDVEQDVIEQQQEDMNSVQETLADQILNVEKEQVATSFKEGILSDQQEIQMSHKQKQDTVLNSNVEASSEQIGNTPAKKEQTKDQHTVLNSQAKPFSSGQLKSSETANTQLQITPYFEQEEELQQTTVAADQDADATEDHNKTPDPIVQDTLLVKQITNTGQTLGKGDDRADWKVMMAEQVSLNRELQLVAKTKEAQLLDVSRQEETAETSTTTESQLSNIDTSPTSNSQDVHYNEKQFGLEPHQNENIKEEQQIAGSFCKDTTAGKADKKASPEGCFSKAIVGWEGTAELRGIAAAEQPSTQDWQVVGKRYNNTKGVITRSQTKNANNSWADKIEEEQVVDQTPISTKVQGGFKASKSRKQLVRQMCKLGYHLNNMGSRHAMRRQLMEEMDALQEEYSLLK